MTPLLLLSPLLLFVILILLYPLPTLRRPSSLLIYTRMVIASDAPSLLDPRVGIFEAEEEAKGSLRSRRVIRSASNGEVVAANNARANILPCVFNSCLAVSRSTLCPSLDLDDVDNEVYNELVL